VGDFSGGMFRASPSIVIPSKKDLNLDVNNATNDNEHRHEGWRLCLQQVH